MKLWNSLLELIPDETSTGKFGIFNDKRTFALYELRRVLEWLKDGYGFKVIYEPEQGHLSPAPEQLRMEIQELKRQLDVTPRTIVGDFPIYEDTGEIDTSYIGSGGPSCGAGTVHVLVGYERREGPNPVAYELERKIESKLRHHNPWVVDVPQRLEIVRGKPLL